MKIESLDKLLEDQLKDLFTLERHRVKTLSGLLTRLKAKIAAYTVDNASKTGLGGHCATWPTFSSEQLHLRRRRCAPGDKREGQEEGPRRRPNGFRQAALGAPRFQ